MTGILTVDRGLQREQWRFWMEMLAPYENREITAAFAEAAKGKDFVSPRLIVGIIARHRSERGADSERRSRELRQLAEREASGKIERVTPEAAERIMQKAGFNPYRSELVKRFPEANTVEEARQMAADPVRREMTCETDPGRLRRARAASGI